MLGTENMAGDILNVPIRTRDKTGIKKGQKGGKEQGQKRTKRKKKQWQIVTKQRHLKNRDHHGPNRNKQEQSSDKNRQYTNIVGEVFVLPLLFPS